MQDDTSSTLLSRHIRRTTKIRTSILKINAYRRNLSSLDEALLKIIEEKDRISYPEERVSLCSCMQVL